MRVVYSRLTDEEAAERIGGVVRASPPAARATLAYLRRMRDDFGGYETDRAYRLLIAAMNGAPPEPVSPANARLFERERSLGWMPLGAAFDQLVSEVPELAQVARWIQSRPPVNEWVTRVEDLVGPASSQSDPFLRSSVASTVVHRYLSVLGDDGDRRVLSRPVWQDRA
jgi:hypothetical protein